MRIVYAYRDDGFMSDRTTWKPRKVFCTSALPRQDPVAEGGGHVVPVEQFEHVVKYRQGKGGVAALISEIVATHLLKAGGMRTLDTRLVMASAEFAASYRGSDVPYTVEPGYHFATLRLLDVLDGPPPSLATLADPADAVNLWAFDTWLCTIDRRNTGNTLLERADQARPDVQGANQDEDDKWYLIASDQSDCFGGHQAFLASTWIARYKNRGVETLKFIDRAIYAAGPRTCVHQAVEKVKRATAGIGAALAEVPREWWTVTGIDMRRIGDTLYERSDSIYTLLNGDVWKDMPQPSEPSEGGPLVVL